MGEFENEILRYNIQLRHYQDAIQRQIKNGFTLVELMVVVAIIAILAAIAMPQFMTATDKARTAKETADMQVIKNATQLYLLDKNVTTPPTVETLYKEGYLTEHVKDTKDKEYTISLENKNGNSFKSIVVTKQE